ncbi:MAG: hypothetical protein KF798_06260 [Candidatus Paracaedibacteraceae bacterium]|nr:hypothetical protein [Candidatus Paracaedibacteraceae bacterium]
MAVIIMSVFSSFLIMFFCVVSAQDGNERQEVALDRANFEESVVEPYINSPPCQEALDALEAYKKQQKKDEKRKSGKCQIL